MGGTLDGSTSSNLVVDGSTVRNPASNPTTGWDGGKNSLVNTGILTKPHLSLKW